MIVGVGYFEVDPDKRDAFLEGHMETMRRSRAEEGCLEYTFAADPLEPGRVVIVEKWESQASLDAHLAALRERQGGGGGPAVAPTAASLTLYETAGETKLI